MSKFVKALLSVLFLFQVGRSYATWNFFEGHLYIPFFDYLWKFDKDCQVGCHYFSFRCFFPASLHSVCRDYRFMHQCCEQFTSTTTTSTTSTTTPSTTTSTEHPPMELCTPTRPERCQPEPACTPRHITSLGTNGYDLKPGCEHKCWKHCFDQCACKTAAEGNCEYHPSTGMCLARGICQEALFKDGDCRRANSFYSVGGLLCQNQKSSERNCENGTTIFAVNINGEPHTDKRGVVYEADREELYEDQYNTRLVDNRHALSSMSKKFPGTLPKISYNG